jgi:hypothetical protein
MSSEKELKILEQGIIVWLLVAAGILIVWAAAFGLAFMVLKNLLWAVFIATFVATASVLAIRKLWRR